MSSDAKDIKTNQAETVGNESVGDKLGYDKDSKERLPCCLLYTSDAADEL